MRTEPIPQNPSRQDQAFRDLLEWNRRTLGGAYEKVGRKDGKWDKSAREALEAAARVAGKAVDPATRVEDVHVAAQRAITEGCDDPLVLYVFADSSRVPNQPEPAELARRWAAAGAAMERSAYPPIRRALALLGAGMSKAGMEPMTTENRKEAGRWFDAVLALVPLAASKEDASVEAEDQWFTLMRSLTDGYRLLDGKAKPAAARLDAVLARIGGLKTMRFQLKAYSLIDEAWEARGNGLGNTVPEDASRIFEAKNLEAYKTLEQAWAYDKKSYRTPNLMLSVITALGGDRQEMETWFRRAMELREYNGAACRSKMNYLDPKWFGSREEMIEFADACKATKNWRAGITVAAASIHMRWAMQLDDEETTKYFRMPEVFADGKAIYDEYLSHYTADDAVRSEYAGFAYFCNQWLESARQFKILGEKLVGSRPYPLEQLKRYRAFAEAVEKQEAEEKAAQSKPK